MMLAHLGEAAAALAIGASAVHVLAQLPAPSGAGMGRSTLQVGLEIAALLGAEESVPAVPGRSRMGELAGLARQESATP